jgi:hypothetical protein
MAIHVMPKRDAAGELASHQAPFKSKAVDGGMLFRRKHGFNLLIDANSTGIITLIVPYAACKINQVEFVNAKVGDTVDLKVHDTATGTLSTIPDYMLNQFGFAAELPDGLYLDKSDYDADLIAGMQIKIHYSNSSTDAHTIRGNITYHEVR